MSKWREGVGVMGRLGFELTFNLGRRRRSNLESGGFEVRRKPQPEAPRQSINNSNLGSSK